ncbi:hypothetical protein TSAR_001715 [Trichomalopsis sarcophagae]|uniref:Uncharacterized protein n=1 Tax=Trichomalopsis sarcophagae TaxID=543379 RepID=A0A232F7F0_9HYME|nr:hypothetical protein TSAR_001715 [Trichomalopsis sarcophagae]
MSHVYTLKLYISTCYEPATVLARRECIRIAGASDCDITQLSAENRSECSDLCVSTPRVRERRLQGVRVDPLWRMLTRLPRSFSSKFHNCVNRYRDFKNP